MALGKRFVSWYETLNCVHVLSIFLGAEEMLSEEILLHVAQFFTDETDCKKLAVFLGDPGGSDFLVQLKRKRSRITPKGIALKILQQWRKEEGDHATRDELLQVLRDDLGWSNIEAQLVALLQWGEASRTMVLCQTNPVSPSWHARQKPIHKWRGVNNTHHLRWQFPEH